MVKIIHTGDLHYSADTLSEVERCMSSVLSAVDATVDAVVIGGDTTDHRLDAHTPAFHALASRIREIASQVPTLLLQGTFSHEPPGMLRTLGLMHDNIFVADRIGQVALTNDGLWVPAPTGYAFGPSELEALHRDHSVKALFSCLPVANPAAVLALRGGTAEAAVSNAQALGDATAAVLAGWGSINNHARELGIPTIGVSHGTTKESRSEHGVPMHSMDHEYTTGMLFAAGCSAFMLNHIHLHQQWDVNGRRVAYSGSLPCLHYGETGDKVFLVWQVATTHAEFEARPSGAQQFADFAFHGVDNIDRVLAELRLADVRGKKVRVRVTLPITARDGFDADTVRAALADAIEVKVEPIYVPVTRVRAEGVGEATHHDRLRLWAESTGLEERLPELEAGLSAALANDAAAIVEQIMRTTAIA